MNFKNKKQFKKYAHQRDALRMQHAAFPSTSFGVGNAACKCALHSQAHIF